MSGTLQASVVKDGASATNNLALDASGNVTVGNNLTVTGTTTHTGTVGATTFTGAVTAPSFIPNSSTIPANGMYLSAANTLDFATNTTNQMSISSTGIVTGTAGNLMLVSGSVQATTSGTNKTFSSIPSWVKRITVMYNGVATNGTSNYLIQLGTSGGLTTSGYSSGCNGGGVGVAQASATNGFLTTATINTTGDLQSGHVIITNVSGNIWVYSSNLNSITASGRFQVGGGAVTLASALTQLSILTVSGNTFTAGSVNILYE